MKIYADIDYFTYVNCELYRYINRRIKYFRIQQLMGLKKTFLIYQWMLSRYEKSENRVMEEIG